jgi:hypothetical protein
MRLIIPFINRPINIPIPVIDNYNERNALSRELVRRVASRNRSIKKKAREFSEAFTSFDLAKKSVYEGSIRRFSEHINKIKDYKIYFHAQHMCADINQHEIPEFQTVNNDARHAIEAAVMGSAGGAISGVVTLTAVSTLATASTGTAISTLSGAAASNAIFAWLGGGSIIAGGGGMAVGAAVLGGVFAVPVVVIGAIVLDRKTKKSLKAVKEDLEQLEKLGDLKDDPKMIIMDELIQRYVKMKTVLEQLDAVLESMVDELKNLVTKYARRNFIARTFIQAKRLIKHSLRFIGKEWNLDVNMDRPVTLDRFSNSDLKTFKKIFGTALMIKSISEVEIISEDGTASELSLQILNAATRALTEPSQA